MKTAAVAAVAALALMGAPTPSSSAGVVVEADPHAEWEMAGRVEGRQEDPLSAEMADRADLFLRAIDGDRDRHVSVSDMTANPAVLDEHFPGVSLAEMTAFLHTADKDGDGLISRQELVDGLAGSAVAGEHPEMLEVDAVRRRKGFVKSLVKGVKNFGKKVIGNVKDKAKTAIRRATGRVDQSQDACVTCQYIIERLETNVRQSGVIPSMPTGDVPMYAAHSNDNPFAPYQPMAPGPSQQQQQQAGQHHQQHQQQQQTGEQQHQQQQQTGETQQQTGETQQQTTDSQQNGETNNFLEVASKDPYDAAAGGIIAATRESTRMQRQMERQKYNEIYRVVDITLDDVCEQSMPSAFYGFCKQIYQTQSDVVEGLRYQYRPADICFRVGMCGQDSYITKGIHSRYQ